MMSHGYRRRRVPSPRRPAASFSTYGLTCDTLMVLEDQTLILQAGGSFGNNAAVNFGGYARLSDETLILDSRERKGLSEDAISRQMKNKICEAYEEGEICVVCQDELVRKVAVAMLDCGHGYHPQCIKNWLARSNTCPLCKAIVLSAS